LIAVNRRLHRSGQQSSIGAGRTLKDALAMDSSYQGERQPLLGGNPTYPYIRTRVRRVMLRRMWTRVVVQLRGYSTRFYFVLLDFAATLTLTVP
jgi:hypothetical protein